MSVDITAKIKAIQATPEYKEKRKLVTIETVAGSEVPYRLTKKKTGVQLFAAVNMNEIVLYLNSYSMASLTVVPTRRRKR